MFDVISLVQLVWWESNFSLFSHIRKGEREWWTNNEFLYLTTLGKISFTILTRFKGWIQQGWKQGVFCWGDSVSNLGESESLLTGDFWWLSQNTEIYIVLLILELFADLIAVLLAATRSKLFGPLEERVPEWFVKNDQQNAVHHRVELFHHSQHRGHNFHHLLVSAHSAPGKVQKRTTKTHETEVYFQLLLVLQ